MNARDIKNKLKSEFHFEKLPDRRTIYAHIKELKNLSELEQFDFQIKEMEGNGKLTAHYVESDMSMSEIKLLCDAIASSRFINKKQSIDLIKRLSDTLGDGDKFVSRYSNRVQYKSTNNKSYNAAIFENIDTLSEAIDQKKKVKFQYLKYDINKKLVPSRSENDGYKIVQPYYLIWAINHYYLMCRYENSEINRFLRVDKMKNVTVSNEKAHPLQNTFNLDDYTRNQAFMFGGKPEPIKFRCEMRMLGQVIDFFGEDVKITPIDEEYFRVRVVTSKESIRYWVLQYITAIDEIEPERLRETIIRDLEGALERNRTQTKKKTSI